MNTRPGALGIMRRKVVNRTLGCESVGLFFFCFFLGIGGGE